MSTSGFVQDGARHREALTLARRERLAASAQDGLEIEHARQQRRAVADGGVGHSVQAPEVAEELAAREARVEARRTGEEAEAAPRRVRVARDVDARELDAALRGDEDRGEHPQRRGLARAVRAEEAVDLAGRDAERQIVDGQRGAEALREVEDGDAGGARHGAPRGRRTGAWTINSRC